MKLDGVLVVEKPVGPTSHDVVAAARRALRLRRIGHTGTLDPLASGVLALVVGQATRLAQFLSAADKEYHATIRFGVDTDSYDMAGRVVQASGLVPTSEAVMAGLACFRGEIEQLPPAFSAKKVEGSRAYVLARGEKPVPLRPARVQVHALELIAFEPPRARLRLHCSAGFYVRSLAHDLGAALGTGAVLEALERRRAGDFTLEQAVSLAELVTAPPETLAQRAVPMERLLPDWPSVVLPAVAVRKLSQGQELRPSDWDSDRTPLRSRHIRVLSTDGRLVAIARPGRVSGFLHPAVVFRYN